MEKVSKYQTIFKMAHLPLCDFFFLRLILPLVLKNLSFYNCISNLVVKAEQKLIFQNLSQNLKVQQSPVVSSNQAWYLFLEDMA